MRSEEKMGRGGNNTLIGGGRKKKKGEGEWDRSVLQGLEVSPIVDCPSKSQLQPLSAPSPLYSVPELGVIQSRDCNGGRSGWDRKV